MSSESSESIRRLHFRAGRVNRLGSAAENNWLMAAVVPFVFVLSTKLAQILEEGDVNGSLLAS